jgi:ribosomal protein L37AE/L43A
MRALDGLYVPSALVEMCEPSNIRHVCFTCKAQFVQARIVMVLHEAVPYGMAFEDVKRLFFEWRCEVCGSGAGGAARVRVVADAV